MKLDFLARKQNYIDHLAPVWNQFPRDWRGSFYVDQKNLPYAIQELGTDGIVLFNGIPLDNSDVVLTAGYSDIMPRGGRGLKITMEHGTGHCFDSNAYPNGRGKRDGVHLALMPNRYTERLAREVRPDTPTVVIGTPKMDGVRQGNRKPADEPVIAIGFHWGSKDSNPPESGNALEHYKSILPELGKWYHVIGTGHPLGEHEFREVFSGAGIEYVADFREVMNRADVYINDLSSTLYEFLLTDKPVIVLNAPWFRRGVQWGIRFWDYSDVGINVEQPGELFPAIDRTLAEYEMIHIRERMIATADLYPNFGSATQTAIKAIVEFMKENA